MQIRRAQADGRDTAHVGYAMQGCDVSSITPTGIVCYLPPGGVAGNSTPIVAVRDRGLAVLQPAAAVQPVYNKLLISHVQPAKVSLAGGSVTITGTWERHASGLHAQAALMPPLMLWAWACLPCASAWPLCRVQQWSLSQRLQLTQGCRSESMHKSVLIWLPDLRMIYVHVTVVLPLVKRQTGT